MGVWTVAWIWCLLIGGLPALAKRPGPKQVAPPSLDEVLTGAGWTMTPERTSTYSVGDIYSRTSNTPVIFKKDCFDAEPREGAYTSLEVVQAMKAGAKMPLGIARIKAGGMEYKQIKFAEPYLTELASLQLVPSQRCRDLVNSLEDTSDLFVIKAILSAEIKEQLCRTIDRRKGCPHRADAAPRHQVDFDPGLVQRPQHTGMIRAGGAGAGQHQCRSEVR